MNSRQDVLLVRGMHLMLTQHLALLHYDVFRQTTSNLSLVYLVTGPPDIMKNLHVCMLNCITST